MFEWFRRRRGEKVGNVSISFLHLTRFKFLIPIFEAVVRVIVAHDKRLQHFSLLLFVLEDEENYKTKGKAALLDEMLHKRESYKRGVMYQKKVLKSIPESSILLTLQCIL